MLSKQISYDHTVTELGHIQVRQITRIMEDGKELSMSYHRHVISPGDDYSDQDERTQVLANAIHTPEVVKAYKAQITDKD
ncbi:MAG: hypothetical protein E3J94_07100 [Desulfobacteraceae bacterium]|nr:MAG: hypothetical protein E3J94_07100 [Desulfobacteraceae bacterium]